MARPFRLIASSCALGLLCAAHVQAFEVPPEGSCAGRPVQFGEDAGPSATDVVPTPFSLGERVTLDELSRLASWLPPEIWERRELFFFEGMELEIGPCYRRYPPAPFFDAATRANAGAATVDSDGNLVGYRGTGLPFAPEAIADAAPDAALRWAWSHRYRYQGSGFRGDFRIAQIGRAGRDQESFLGSFFFMPLHGVPDGAGADRKERFAAGGSFREPEVARGLAWRQFQPVAVETDYRASDDVFVYVPGQRKVRRAPPQQNEGVYVPSYTRARSIDNVGLTLPDGSMNDVGNPAMAAGEPLRRGFVGLVIRPNAYAWTFDGARDVLAPANSKVSGYPVDEQRNYGPSGLSLASDRWELRRAALISGVRKQPDGEVARVQIWIDALTLQPLYWISRRANGGIYEVGIFGARFSADDVLDTKWSGSGTGFGVMLPVVETMAVAGQGGGWLRESYTLRSDPPGGEEAQDFLSVQGLQRKGR